MLNRRPLRHKLILGSCLLLAMVGMLFTVTIIGGLSYRQAARDISARSAELPLAIDFSVAVTELRHTLYQAKRSTSFGFHESILDTTILREEFRAKSLAVEQALRQYEAQLDRSDAGDSGERAVPGRRRCRVARPGRLTSVLTFVQSTGTQRL